MNHTLKNPILDLFHHFHSHPETSWHEVETTAYITNLLKENGCRVRTFADCTGVVGDIGAGEPVVAIRADMDALWQEVDGDFQGNHSCGHDAHMAVVLGTLLTIKQSDQPLNGTVRFIFQPAEEKGTGALKMVDEQVVDDVDYLYGVHLRPIQEIPHGTASPSLYHGAARFISGKIKGEDAHGARPHLNTNAIDIGAALVNRVNSIHQDPMIPHSAKLTSFHAGGESANIIPGSAQFSIDLRAQSNEVMEGLTAQLEKSVRTLEEDYGVTIELQRQADVAAAVVHPEAQSLMEKTIISVLGSEQYRAPLVTTGGDDFHFYTIKRPELKATMLGLGCDLEPGLHHPHMSFNHEAILNGVDILTDVILRTLNKERD